MNSLRQLRGVLQQIAQQVEVLPAVGGAIEDLDRPDAEEGEDRFVNADEQVFDTIFERYPAGKPQLYRPVPPLPRNERHLFRYFLDGSFRSYFLGTVLENERETPVHFAQVGACAIRREPDGSVRREVNEVRSLLLLSKQQVSETLWTRLQEWTETAGILLVDLGARSEVAAPSPDVDLRSLAAGKVRYEMRKLEAELLLQVLQQGHAEEDWAVADGSLLFEPILRALLNLGDPPRALGVAKNFRKDPQFVFGRGPRQERRSIYKLLSELNAGHRTAAFSAREGKAVFWYVRIREQKHLDYPLMGVVKVELANPSQEAADPELIDTLSRCLVAERHTTPHGRDRRWHAHLYPIYLAEQAIRESLWSREVVQQYMRWR